MVPTEAYVETYTTVSLQYEAFSAYNHIENIIIINDILQVI